MLAALKSFFGPFPITEQAHAAYVRIVSQSRNQKFYTDFGVADTIDGRFDVIVLHLSLVLNRLKSEQQMGEFKRVLQEVFFADMDRSLREMGVTDTGVGKRIKKMTQAFYGRLQTYEIAFDDEKLLAEALSRNLYRGIIVSETVSSAIANYIQRTRSYLETQPVDAFTAATFNFSVI